MAIKAKFLVQQVTSYAGTVGSNVVLSPVINGDTPENKAFWDATPNGKVELFISNPAAAEQFKAGDTFYLTFEKAEFKLPVN